MAKTFNITAACRPDEHYMVRLDQRLSKIKELIDAGKYFTINRARQYGKTTTLHALAQYLQRDYYIVSLDFQTFGAGEFENENIFALSFARSFLRLLKRKDLSLTVALKSTIERLNQIVSKNGVILDYKGFLKS